MWNSLSKGKFSGNIKKWIASQWDVLVIGDSCPLTDLDFDIVESDKKKTVTYV